MSAERGRNGESLMNIGFIGLGIMGSPMAANLVRAGHTVVGYDMSADRMDALAEAGGKSAGSVAETVAQAEVVITMLPDSPQVEEVAFGDDGRAAARQAGLSSRRHEHREAGDLAPVAQAAAVKGIAGTRRPGERRRARARSTARLSIMVGGDAEDFAAAAPILEGRGHDDRARRPSGAGQTVKAANQLVVGGIGWSPRRSCCWRPRGWIRTAALDVLGGGLAGCRILDLKRHTMIERRVHPRIPHRPAPQGHGHRARRRTARRASRCR